MNTKIPSQTEGRGVQPSATLDEQRVSRQAPANDQDGLYPQFVLFGDSITQRGCATLQPQLQSLYIRQLDSKSMVFVRNVCDHLSDSPAEVQNRCSLPSPAELLDMMGENRNDHQIRPAQTCAVVWQHIKSGPPHVVNRGFGGYTAVLGLSVLPKFLPEFFSTPSPAQPAIRLLTVFFGANDACHPGYPQHVPLTTYVASLRRIIQYSVFQKHETKVILVTPAPVNEWQLNKPISRTANNARRYAQAARQLAEELQIPYVDLWTIFMKIVGYSPQPSDLKESYAELSACDWRDNANAGTATGLCGQDSSDQVLQEPALPGSIDAPPNDILPTLLEDGLHFTPKAYKILCNELMTVIRRDLPEYAPGSQPWIYPEWKDMLGVPPVESSVTTSAKERETTAITTESVTPHFESLSTLQIDTDVDADADADADADLDKMVKTSSNSLMHDSQMKEDNDKVTTASEVVAVAKTE